MEKRGIASIIVTIIIIGLSLAAIAIIWVVIQNLLSQGTGSLGLGGFTIRLQINRAYTTSDSLVVQVSRLSGEGNLSSIVFVISNDTDKTTIIQSANLNQLETKNFVMNLSDINIANIKTVAIAPIYASATGKSTTGNIVDTYDFTKQGNNNPNQGTCSPACGSSTPFCDSSDQCVACLGDSDCSTQGSGFTCQSGTCINSSSEGVCSPACDSGLFCNPSNQCVECLGDSNCDSFGFGLICESGSCTSSTSPGQCSPSCSGSTPYCNPTNQCVECLQDANCASYGSGFTCESGICENITQPPRECDPACTAPFPLCNTNLLQCVECLANSDCSSKPATPFCDTFSSFTCVGCLTDSYCSSTFGPGFTCNNTQCANTTCVPKSDAAACGTDECGQELNGCGGYVKCGSNGGNCSDQSTQRCFHNMCNTQTPILSGNVQSVWPNNINQLFSSSDLYTSPTDYSGNFIRFTGGTESGCLLINFHYNADPQNSFVLMNRHTSVQVGNTFHIWGSNANDPNHYIPDGFVCPS